MLCLLAGAVCWAGDCTTLYWIGFQGDWLLAGEDLFPLAPEQKEGRNNNHRESQFSPLCERVVRHSYLFSLRGVFLIQQVLNWRWLVAVVVIYSVAA